MSSAPRIGIPPLAGLCTLEEAARIGYSVDESVAHFLRYHWIEKRLAEICAARIPSTPEWEVKGAFALHQWLDIQHADMLRNRIREMRHPMPRIDVAPNAEVEQELTALDQAGTTRELLDELLAIRTSLLDAYREHYERSNPVVDHPTRRLLRIMITEEEEMVRWTEAAARGIQPQHERTVQATSHKNFEPVRDERFKESYNFNFPPHNVYALEYVPPEERNLALLCKRLLEMDVPEMMASFVTERADQPWEFQLDYRRQLWDEARHSMMGEAAFEKRGVDWTKIPLNVGFALRLNLFATPQERQLLLFSIEQSLMPAETGKRYEFETALAAGDELSAHFQDFDWADEVLHAQIGRRWLKTEGIHGADVLERGNAVHEKTWEKLEHYRARQPQRDWWNDFVLQLLGKPSKVRPEDLVNVKVVAE
jgi:bacterioferritin (cytochrome b1)